MCDDVFPDQTAFQFFLYVHVAGFEGQSSQDAAPGFFRKRPVTGRKDSQNGKNDKCRNTEHVRLYVRKYGFDRTN